MKWWSSTQDTVATSSGEAEQNALVRGATEALGSKSVLDELGWEVPIDIKIDSAAAESMGCQQGLGKQHRGEAFVGAGSASTKAVPHRQDSWDHRASSHPHQPEVNGRHSGSAGFVSASRSTGRCDQTQVLPRAVVCTCSRRPNPACQAVGGLSDMSLEQSQCLLLT